MILSVANSMDIVAVLGSFLYIEGGELLSYMNGTIQPFRLGESARSLSADKDKGEMEPPGVLTCILLTQLPSPHRYHSTSPGRMSRWSATSK